MPGRLDKDHELINRAQQGDPVAFGDLYERHAPAIFRYLYAHLDNLMDAEDLTCEVFLNAWQSLPKYIERGVPFLAFLFRIARNALVDHYRQSNRTESNISDDLENVRDKVSAESADIVSQNMEHRNVLQVLSRLRPDYQTVITLRFISELSPEETAQAMDRSVGAVRVLQHRALNALREELHQAS